MPPDTEVVWGPQSWVLHVPSPEHLGITGVADPSEPLAAQALIALLRKCRDVLGNLETVVRGKAPQREKLLERLACQAASVCQDLEDLAALDQDPDR